MYIRTHTSLVANTIPDMVHTPMCKHILPTTACSPLHDLPPAFWLCFWHASQHCPGVLVWKFEPHSTTSPQYLQTPWHCTVKKANHLQPAASKLWDMTCWVRLHVQLHSLFKEYISTVYCLQQHRLLAVHSSTVCCMSSSTPACHSLCVLQCMAFAWWLWVRWFRRVRLCHYCRCSCRLLSRNLLS